MNSTVITIKKRDIICIKQADFKCSNVIVHFNSCFIVFKNYPNFCYPYNNYRGKYIF